MTPEPPPEAVIIARKRTEQHLSRLEAGRRAGISETRYRQLETGVIRIRGTDYPEKAPAETLARMAWAVGVTADELETAGREDAAAELRRLPAGDEFAGEVRAVVDQISGSRVFSERQKRALTELILRDTTDDSGA
jgi:transcriptional regulator with XRE-family HTH domain